MSGGAVTAVVIVVLAAAVLTSLVMFQLWYVLNAFPRIKKWKILRLIHVLLTRGAEGPV